MIPYPLFTSRWIQQRSFRMKENTDDLREEIEKLNQELSTLQHKLKMRNENERY